MPAIAADADSTAYSISTDEMERRGRGFTTLVVSLLAGITVSSIDDMFLAPTNVLPCPAGLSLVGVLPVPVLHRFMHRFHLGEDDKAGTPKQ